MIEKKKKKKSMTRPKYLMKSWSPFLCQAGRLIFDDKSIG
jgi:hypothetical protein